MGELKLLSQLELEERRSRKGSSNEGSRHSRTSSTSGPHSTSLSSEDGCEVGNGGLMVKVWVSSYNQQSEFKLEGRN